jgi:3-methyladenine DNA glycosylase AlkC
LIKSRERANKWARKEYKKNPNKYCKMVREYYAANSERIRKEAKSKCKEWYKKNSEKAKEAAKEWSQNNPNRRLEIGRKWRKEHPEEAREFNRKWAKENPEKLRVKSRRRRALQMGNGGDHTVQQWFSIKEQYGNECLCCHKKEQELLLLGLLLVPDHVIPIAHGGINCVSNLQPLCQGKGGCNNRKGVKHTDYRFTKGE